MTLRWMLLAYALLSAATLGALYALRGDNWFWHPAPWFQLEPAVRETTSAFVGVTLALAVVASTRTLVTQTRWASALARELSPFALSVTGTSGVLLAVFSSLGEELLFRALLSPLYGNVSLVATALFFGLVHQVRGVARWGWVAWATVLGLLLGCLHAATGSLLGPLLAHALINGINLSFLRERARYAR